MFEAPAPYAPRNPARQAAGAGQRERDNESQGRVTNSWSRWLLR